MSWSSTYAVAPKKTQYIEVAEKTRYAEGYTYCHSCKKNMPKDALRCSICNNQVRRRPTKTKHWVFKRID